MSCSLLSLKSCLFADFPCNDWIQHVCGNGLNLALLLLYFDSQKVFRCIEIFVYKVLILHLIKRQLFLTSSEFANRITLLCSTTINAKFFVHARWQQLCECRVELHFDVTVVECLTSDELSNREVPQAWWADVVNRARLRKNLLSMLYRSRMSWRHDGHKCSRLCIYILDVWVLYYLLIIRSLSVFFVMFFFRRFR